MSSLRLWYRATATAADEELDHDTLETQVKPLLMETMAGDITLITLMAATEQTSDRLSAETWGDGDLSFTLGVLPPPLAICRDVGHLRQRVAHWGYGTADGALYLPIVWTGKGPLYGEVIGKMPGEHSGEHDCQYRQPVHLGDSLRQPLYRLGQRLIGELGGIPSCYLLQFALKGDGIDFDRLWPFPTRAALASMGIQEPDLFTCHGRCLRGEAIYDLRIGSHHPYYHPTDF
ncbi:hypothetical protein L3556_02040 [Candidatus Synechococcus calcipolaris G9]|uniref:Uncharacterized protein n=1 Tax=Candidatus Synechococcus calcipolaris G9 TaxID=1497997 RepID=A0ABT6EXU4_9SYNE|nr:hypothetical protein [Candidatus Synechococcus calcipolaris]MDG2989720.1 hypothetical protein [Candidatus Synechococcus calcipolaris G9]